MPRNKIDQSQSEVFTGLGIPNDGDVIVYDTATASWKYVASSTFVGGAPVDSPTFTGVPAAPTANVGTNTTQLATTEFVQGQLVSSLADYSLTSAINAAFTSYYTAAQVDAALTGYSSTGHNHAGIYEPVFAKNTAFNANYGTGAGTVCEGNDSRLSDARTPTSHTHTESQITDLDKYTQAEVDALIAAISPAGSFKGVLLTNTASQNIVSQPTTTDLTWNTEEYDTDGFHDNVTNPERITVPAGVSKVRVGAEAAFTSAGNGAGYRAIQITKTPNDNFPRQMSSDLIEPNSTYGTTVRANCPIVDVAPGDYFVAKVRHLDGADLSVGGHNTSTKFWLEVIE